MKLSPRDPEGRHSGLRSREFAPCRSSSAASKDDRLLVESLATAMCVRLARHFVGRLQLPTSGGLSPERLQRVRDYVEAHLGEDLSLTVLAEIACLSPYHFSRSFTQATGLCQDSARGTVSQPSFPRRPAHPVGGPLGSCAVLEADVRGFCQIGRGEPHPAAAV